MKDYLEEFTRYLATSFCKFKTKKDVGIIKHNVAESNLSVIFDNDFFYSVESNPDLAPNVEKEKYISLFKSIVQKSIEENGHVYAMTRFIIIESMRVEKGYVLEELFWNEDWFNECQQKGKKVLSEIFDDPYSYSLYEMIDDWDEFDKRLQRKINKMLFTK